jgi:uncharacterized protein
MDDRKALSATAERAGALPRREMTRMLGAACGGLALHAGLPTRATSTTRRDYTSRRPPASERRFASPAVEEKIVEVRRSISDPELAWLFENCFPNTLDTTVEFAVREGRPDTLVITGDIPAMWLRDSTAQVTPYVPLARRDARLKELIAGVINRQTRCILIDPYANAFSFGREGACPWGEHDQTQTRPELCERKWEVDSLCYPARLAHAYWRATGDTSCFDADFRQAGRLVLQTFREQQRKDGPGPYSFQRQAASPYDTLPLDGRGNPARPVGLIHSGFRPSDDACVYPLLVPSNFFAVVALRQLAELHESALGDKAFAGELLSLAEEVSDALARHAVTRHPARGLIWAYEVDGFGNSLMMDDANAPSLLSLPYLGCCPPRDPVYRRTRAFVLSEDNPYFFRGRAGEGVGGPHVGLGMVWPLGIIMRALTSEDAREVAFCLKMLKATHAGTGFMHEAFSKDDPARFTRPWFAWANTLFGELILHVHSTRPGLLGPGNGRA